MENRSETLTLARQALGSKAWDPPSQSHRRVCCARVTLPLQQKLVSLNIFFSPLKNFERYNGCAEANLIGCIPLLRHSLEHPLQS